MSDARAWLAQVRHDLVKRMVWPARDRRDLGGPVLPGELVPRLVDAEGRPVAPLVLWAELVVVAPRGIPPAALTTFGEALAKVTVAAARDDLAGVLALEIAFDNLTMNSGGS